MHHAAMSGGAVNRNDSEMRDAVRLIPACKIGGFMVVWNCLQITDASYSRLPCISGLSSKEVASVIFRQFL